MTIVNLVVGDWSADGHGKTDTFSIKTTFSVADVELAYLQGAQKLGHDIRKSCCQNYEDSCIPIDIMNSLFEHGFDKNSLERSSDFEEEEYDGFPINQEDWVKIFLFTCKLGDPNFKYSYVKGCTLNIGGYGFFY